jgi:hypothetical protein
VTIYTEKPKLDDFVNGVLAQPIALFFIGLFGVYATEFVKSIAKRHAASTEEVSVRRSASETLRWMKQRQLRIGLMIAVLSILVWWFFDPCRAPRAELTGEQFQKCDMRWFQLPF